MRKGDGATALGFPLIELQGQEMKATFGRVNAVSGAGGDVRYFQIDAPIQPGNSGGPVLDDRGRVIASPPRPPAPSVWRAPKVTCRRT